MTGQPPRGHDAHSAGWHERVAEFWSRADETDAERMRAELEALVAERPALDPDALFARASLHDFLGEEDAAIPLYRAALEAGLAPPLRSQAVIQLASSLRNVGDPSGAIAALRSIDSADELAPAAEAFLALALFDDGKPAEALRAALQRLAPALPAYSRAVDAYASALHAPPRVRSIVVGALVVDDHVLAEEYAASATHGPFLRLPGGGIEFGESAREALDREFAEELAATLDDAEPLGVSENIFDRHGRRGHEIVHAFRVRSTQLEALPRDARLPVLDGDTSVGWYPLEALRRGELPLYPPAVIDLAP